MLRLQEVKELMQSATGDVIPAMVEIDRVMTPILTELVKLEPGNHDHPATKQLFNWLVDPVRTGEEFLYVIGQLRYKVSNMDAPFLEDVETYRCGYLNRVAAEAMAVNSPVLEGSWELAAWVMVMETYSNTEDFEAASDHLSAWVIQVIRDHDLCPNPYLRIELIILLINMVDINDHNCTQALESVLSACSFLTIDYLFDSQHGEVCDIMDLSFITSALKLIENEFDIFEFDRKLSVKLVEVKSSRLSAVTHDAAYYTSTIHPTSYVIPLAFYGIAALLKNIAGLSQIHLKRMFEITPDSDNIHGFNLLSSHTSLALCMIIKNFKMTCTLTHLVELTASSIMDVIEFVIFVNVGLYFNTQYPLNEESLSNLDQVLEEVFYKHENIWNELKSAKYKERLNCLKYIQFFTPTLELPSLKLLPLLIDVFSK